MRINMLQATAKGFANLERALKTESIRQEKAMNTSVKVEGFRLMRLLKKQVREGVTGGRKFHPLTFLSRSWGGTSKRLRPNKPLRRLAIAVRYFVKDQHPFDMRIGWTGPKTSKSWKRIAAKQQQGFTARMSQSRREYFMGMGARMGKRSVARKYMFIRKSTKRFKTPARPILDPFWQAEEHRAWRNIQRNFRLKMKGQRI